MLMGVAAQLGFGALDRCWLKEVLAERIEDQTKSCSGLREMTIERQSGDWGFDCGGKPVSDLVGNDDCTVMLSSQ